MFPPRARYDPLTKASPSVRVDGPTLRGTALRQCDPIDGRGASGESGAASTGVAAADVAAAGVAAAGVAAAGVPAASVEADQEDPEENSEQDTDILLLQAGNVLIDALVIKNPSVASNR